MRNQREAFAICQRAYDNAVPEYGMEPDSTTVYRVNKSEIVKARKEHKDEYGNTISPGEYYLYVYQQGWEEVEVGEMDGDEDGEYWNSWLERTNYFKVARKYKVTEKVYKRLNDWDREYYDKVTKKEKN